MIHIIEHQSGLPPLPLVDGMFADRKRLFVDLFGWDLPVIDGRLEIDQFDGEHVAYIIAASSDGGHEASMRLMPSSMPHMLAEIFPHLCPGGVPVGPDTWESSRLCLPQRHGATRRKELRNELISAMVDFALAREIGCITGLIPENFRKDVLSMGWQAEPLGPVVRVGGRPVGAFAIHVRPDTPARLRWTGVYVGEKASADTSTVAQVSTAVHCPEQAA
jgi:N-acyl-L-homoserine lactone synthetase